MQSWYGWCVASQCASHRHESLPSSFTMFTALVIATLNNTTSAMCVDQQLALPDHFSSPLVFSVFISRWFLSLFILLPRFCLSIDIRFVITSLIYSAYRVRSIVGSSYCLVKPKTINLACARSIHDEERPNGFRDLFNWPIANKNCLLRSY